MADDPCTRWSVAGLREEARRTGRTAKVGGAEDGVLASEVESVLSRVARCDGVSSILSDSSLANTRLRARRGRTKRTTPLGVPVVPDV